jgi:GT2 family glycosyltransferase
MVGERLQAQRLALSKEPNSQTKLAVVIVNYESSLEIGNYLAGRTTLPPGTAIYIVDNFSSKDEREKCRLLCERWGWRFIPMESNAGFGAACNAGVGAALASGSTHILLLNPDAAIEAHSIARLLETSKAEPTAIVAPQIVREGNGSVWFSGGVLGLGKGYAFHSPADANRGDPDWLTGACMLLTAETWVALGGFDESYFLYWEDVDLTYRWKRAGGTLIVDTGAKASHAVGGTQGTVNLGKSPLYAFQNLANRGRFARNNLTVSRRLWWFCVTPLYVWKIYNMRGQTDRRRYASALLRGMIAGSGLLLGSQSRNS